MACCLAIGGELVEGQDQNQARSPVLLLSERGASRLRGSYTYSNSPTATRQKRLLRSPQSIWNSPFNTQDIAQENGVAQDFVNDEVEDFLPHERKEVVDNMVHGILELYSVHKPETQYVVFQHAQTSLKYPRHPPYPPHHPAYPRHPPFPDHPPVPDKKTYEPYIHQLGGNPKVVFVRHHNIFHMMDERLQGLYNATRPALHFEPFEWRNVLPAWLQNMVRMHTTLNTLIPSQNSEQAEWMS